MAQEMEKPRITEVQVRMDCNGCVQKIKKALHSVSGIQDLYIDLPQQKIMIIGWAEPAQPAEHASDESGTMEPRASEAEPALPVEPPKVVQPSQSPVENLPPETNPSLEERQTSEADIAASQPANPSRPRDVEEVHVIYHYPPDYKYRNNYGQSGSFGHGFSGSTRTNPRGLESVPEQPSPQYATHNYNTSRAALSVPEQSSPQYATHNYNTSRAAPPLPEYTTINYNTYRPESPSSQYTTHNYNSYRREPPPPQYATQNYNTYRAEPPGPQYATNYSIYRPESSLPQYVTSNVNASRSEPPPLQYETRSANRTEPPMLENATQNDNTSWSQPPPPLCVTHNHNTYRPEAQPIMYTNLNYNTYKPSPYVTQYEYIRPSPQYSHYSRAMPNSEDSNYYYGNKMTDRNITSVFSDEDPNSCTIV